MLLRRERIKMIMLTKKYNFVQIFHYFLEGFKTVWLLKHQTLKMQGLDFLLIENLQRGNVWESIWASYQIMIKVITKIILIVCAREIIYLEKSGIRQLMRRQWVIFQDLLIILRKVNVIAILCCIMLVESIELAISQAKI